jgi:DNA-binding protein
MTDKNSTKSKKDDNIIFIGNKPIMSYVLATVAEFNGKSTDTVAIKARGQLIYKAVDVAEIVRGRFLTQTQLKDIKIGTENVTNRNGKAQNVSIIEIYLTTKAPKK